MQSSSSYTVVVYDKNLECHWTACFELLNGNITLHYAIPMPNWSSAIYYKGNLFIYEIITWHVEKTISLLIWFFFARLNKLEPCVFFKFNKYSKKYGIWHTPEVK